MGVEWELIGVEWESDESCLDIDRSITYVIVLGWFKRQRTVKIRGERLTDFCFVGKDGTVERIPKRDRETSPVSADAECDKGSPRV